LPEFDLGDKLKEKRTLISFYLEVTARCNNNCRHCYINLPVNDPVARNKRAVA
jgi:MoaA/NifB/PqqE/SkfB family radical SAM enzyme